MELVQNSTSNLPGAAPDPQAFCGQPGRDGLPVQANGQPLTKASQWCTTIYAAPLCRVTILLRVIFSTGSTQYL